MRVCKYGERMYLRRVHGFFYEYARICVYERCVYEDLYICVCDGVYEGACR